MKFKAVFGTWDCTDSADCSPDRFLTVLVKSKHVYVTGGPERFGHPQGQQSPTLQDQSVPDLGLAKPVEETLTGVPDQVELKLDSDALALLSKRALIEAETSGLTAFRTQESG